MFVAVSLVGARSLTMFCMVMVDFLIQLNMTYQIIKLQKNVTFNDDEKSRKEKRTAVLKLTLAELSEGLVPLAYAMCFSMAYYGPNANLIGNVKNGYWHFKAVKEANWTFIVMLGLSET